MTLFALVLGLATLSGFLLEQIYQRAPASAPDNAASSSVSSVATPEPMLGPAFTGSRAPVALPKEIPPWESTPENTPVAGKGYTPAWAVRPPRPEPITVVPPVPPPDPATTRPSMFNPGGVNGTRPPRPVPGLP